MPNTNFQTFHQMGDAINKVVRQATGRDNVENIDMDFVTVAQNKTIGELTVSGNPAAFSMVNSVPLQKVLIGFNPIQASGTPSPENVLPISGRTGLTVSHGNKNLFDQDYLLRASGCVKEPEELPTYEGVPVYKVSLQNLRNAIGIGNGLPVNFTFKPNTRYSAGWWWRRLTPSTANGLKVIFEYTDGTQAIMSNNFNNTEEFKSVYYTSSENKTVRKILLEYNSSTTCYFAGFFIQEFEGRDISKPLSGTTTLSITFPDPPETVYQGSLDVISGALTVTHVMKTFIGSESEDWRNSFGSNGFRIATGDMKVALLNTGLCNWLPVLSEVGSDMGVALGLNDSDIYARHITDNLEIADLTEWKAYLALHPLEVFYPLETAQIYQLTPQDIETLVGDNVVFTDGDSLEVMYYQYGEVI